MNGDGEGKGQLRNADEVARAVWKFFSAAGGCVEEMVGKGQKEGEDEVRLLRMRLRRSELVVVPGAFCRYYSMTGRGGAGTFERGFLRPTVADECRSEVLACCHT